jgi:hypothetical protein
LIAQAAVTLNASCTESDRGWRLTISVGQGRKQTVHVLRADKPESEQLVAFLSICGPATSELAMTLLEWNAKLTGCAFAVRTINGDKMTVLTSNLPVSLLDSSIVADTLRTIAEKADQVERKLSAGADRY